jgi:multiple sugar transport system substrate-binding protein
MLLSVRLYLTRRRFLLASSMATGGISLLTGCRRRQERPAMPAPLEPATIRFTYWGASPDEIQVQDRVIATFREKLPQIQVENAGEPSGTGPYHEKLLVQLAGGTAPDVARIQSANMPRFALRGLLVALDELIRRDRYALDDFWPAVLPLGRYQEKLYTLPVIGGPNPLFWNGRLFRQAGLPAPTEEDARGTWTWERFADVARQLTRREGDSLRTVGFSVNFSWEGLGPFLWSAGGDYFDAERRRCTLTDAPAGEAVQFLADLLHKHGVAPRPGEPTEGLRWFPEGTIAMQISPITSAYQRRRDPQFEFDVVLNPRGRAGQIGLLNANGYGILAGTRAQPAAWEFHKHLASAETLLYLASLGRSFPWRRSVAQAREYRESQPVRSVDVLFRLVDKNGKTWPVVPAWIEIEAAANLVLRAIAEGKLGLREGLERIKTEADRLLLAG